ncbi:hypothetical protein [Staphylococcus phage vB_SepM_ phiIPLA-C1C]|uniref:Uncharacterized protein n=1 Tax=Staphylococcus phage vB_SepM_ phiIPLA-C1C TaxID=1572704 RepID=A0A0D3MVA2_9CAUD|nr:hypothetical protein AVU40_gp081 [Staphylococcus phage phiIPLA-C1C]QLF87276.1 hypothetical protein BESEP6_00122 [Staphylococcus phage vB_SepM_BE06]QLF87427.1 hypothetical protein BESEP7_00079 [Staphylococcus phage vB_SepM_BE07]QLF87711.1 hypothetical protein BESEP8_00163 [Staphylococcus phage vB_SepM_BE08]QLF87901.1 hypothetical protein BESEP9_00153 [Staphylococcus phage vB_SepM_BE09]WEU70391.1 hypothetical protein BE24_0138 [Staphylococcus phage vB_SepM_BE24]
MYIFINPLILEKNIVDKFFKENIQGISKIKYETDINRVSFESVEDEDVIFVGYIYKNIDTQYLKGSIYYVSNIGLLPDNFITVTKEEQHLSLLKQLMILLDIKDDKWLSIARDFTNYFNFINLEEINYTQVEKELNIDEVYISMMLDRVVDGGNNFFFLNENDVIYKYVLAHRILRKRNTGVVVITSQTRSNSDLITFHCKNVDKNYLTKVFDTRYNDKTNVFSLFIPSSVNRLAKNTMKFIKEGN